MLLLTEARRSRIEVDYGEAILILSFRIGQKLFLTPEVVVGDLWVVVDHE